MMWRGVWESRSKAKSGAEVLPLRVQACVRDHGSPVKLVLRVDFAPKVGRRSRNQWEIGAEWPTCGRSRGRFPYFETSCTNFTGDPISDESMRRRF